jgi:acyl-coenzyme A synthetase/AMP-(fatty) acid ligase
VAEKLKHISQIKEIIQIEELENYFNFYDNDIYYNTYYDRNNELLPNSSEFMSAVMFTSGTTGRPKPIIRGHTDLIYSSIELQDPDLLGLDSDKDCASFNMPVFHSGGLYYLLHFLIAGCKMAFFSGYDEQKFLSYVEKYKVCLDSCLFLSKILL